MEQRVQLDAEKKLNVYANYERQEKHANSLFHKEIEHSHDGEMIKFLKFQGKLLFSDFFSRIISFCQPLCPASEVQF